MIHSPGVFDLLQIFWNPARVFARVRQKKTWAAPFLAIVFLVAVKVVLVFQLAGIELLTLQRYQHNPVRAAQLGNAGIEHEISTSNQRGTKLLILSREAGYAILTLILLAVAFTIAAGFAASGQNFFAMLGAVSFSAYPVVLFAVLISFVLLSAVPDHAAFDLENLPGLNLGRTLDRAGTNPIVFAAASQVDALIAAGMLLMSYALKCVASVTFAKGFAICGIVWVVAVLWKSLYVAFL